MSITDIFSARPCLATSSRTATVAALVLLLGHWQTALAGGGLAPWHPSEQFFASDGAADDRFGNSVALDGNLALVGAPEHDALGSNAGAAYLFDTAIGSELHKLVALDLPPNDFYAGDQFGFAVALDGARALVSAPLDDEFGGDAGAVYAFDTTTGLQTQKLAAPIDIVGGEQLGYSIAISGSTAVVGALTAEGFASASGTGAAYVYQHNGTIWEYDQKLVVDDPNSLQDGDMFGWSVDLDGTTAIVGGRDGLGNAGTAYLFDTITGLQLAKLSAADNGETGLSATSGSAVAVRGAYAVVGATAAQAAYVFEDDGLGNWTLTDTLTASDTAADDQFGFSLALDGTRAVVSARKDDDNFKIDSGSAYVFDVELGTQIDKLVPANGNVFEEFGYAVDMDDGRILAGVVEGFDISADRTGSAYLFAATQAADFNEDGSVNGLDLVNWEAGVGTLNADHTDGDADLDGDVDGIDFLTWQRQLETPAAIAGLGQVPEPGALCLSLTAAISVLLFWRREPAGSTPGPQSPT